MPHIQVDWDKSNPSEPLVRPAIFPAGLLRAEPSPVLHAARAHLGGFYFGGGAGMHYPTHYRTYVESAVAWAKVTCIESVLCRAIVSPPGSTSAPSDTHFALANIWSTRLYFRSGKVTVLHPLSEIEPLFCAYRQLRDFPKPSVGEPPRGDTTHYLVYRLHSSPTEWVSSSSVVHDEVLYTTQRDKACRFPKWGASEFIVRLGLRPNAAGVHEMEPA